jgi:hypothetical protein
VTVERQEADWHWIKVGTNSVYLAIVEGSVAAVVYCTDEELGTSDDGSPIVTTAGWFWFPTDRPDLHEDLEFEVPDADAARGSLDPEDDAALEAAATRINEHLGLDGHGDDHDAGADEIN